MKLDERIIGFFDYVFEMSIMKFILWSVIFTITDGTILTGFFLWYLIKKFRKDDSCGKNNEMR